MRNRILGVTLFALTFLPALLSAAFAGNNAAVIIALDSPSEVYEVGPGATVEVTLLATGMVRVKQLDIILEVSPIDAFDLSATTFAYNADFFQISSGVEFPGRGRVKSNAASFGSAADEDGALGTFTLTTSASFTTSTQATITVVRVSIGPSSTDRDVFEAADLGLSVSVLGSQLTIGDTVGGGCGEDDPPFLSMPDVEGRKEDTVIFPVTLDQASLVAGGDFTISYDPSLLSLQEVRNGDLTSGGDFVVISNINEEGMAVISIAGSRLIGIDEGSLLELEFQAGEFQFGQTNMGEVRFQRAALVNEHGEPMCADWQNGSITLQVGLPGDVNRDDSVTSADAILVLRSAVDLITLDAIQRILADVNEDGRIGAGDAVLILRKAAGLIAKAVVGTESSPKVAWGIPEKRMDGKVAVPLLLEGDIYGGDFVMRYDVGAYKPSGVRISGETGVWAMDTDRLSELHFTVASAVPFRKLEVVLESIEAGGESELLSLEEAFLVDGAGRSVEAEMSSIEVALAPTVSALPGQYALLPNYPNPFNPSTTIRYDVPKAGSVVLRIYDVTSQMVRELVDASQSAGRYSVMWDGRDTSGERVANGVYLYELRAGDFRAIRKMVLMK